MLRLKDKVALITGSGMGLGQAMALLFSREGAKIVVPDINMEAGEETVDAIRKEGGDAIFVRADVSKGDDAERMIRAAVDTYGRIDVLVNNAGVQVEKSVPDTTEEEWDYVLGVNLKGTFLCSRAAIPQMRRQGSGSIICISSISGLVGQPNQASYNASKHGVIGLVRSMACDHAQEHIRGQRNLSRIYEHTDGGKHPRRTSSTVSQGEPFRTLCGTDGSCLCRSIFGER